jgi:hypothetical protein
VFPAALSDHGVPVPVADDPCPQRVGDRHRAVDAAVGGHGIASPRGPATALMAGSSGSVRGDPAVAAPSAGAPAGHAGDAASLLPAPGDPHMAVPQRPGRPTVNTQICELISRPARENPLRGYRRVHDELVGLGYRLSESTLRQILRAHGSGPAPRQADTSWPIFLRAPADELLACDFISPRHDFPTPSGRPVRDRDTDPQVHILGVIFHPTGQRGHPGRP